MKPNHKDGCDGTNWRHSGDGYNRVRVCACGAEDHDPTPESVAWILHEDTMREMQSLIGRREQGR